MTNPAASQFETLAALYEDMARWPFRRDIEIPSVMGVLGDLSGKDVLDFGCGTGMYARWIKDRGARRVVGFDLAEGMLSFARRQAAAQGYDIRFVDALTDDLARQFDVVVAVYVLPYAGSRDELDAMCASMARLLRPGGRLVALPIHPDYHPDPDFYRPLGLSYAADDPATAPHKDGGVVHVSLSRGGQSAAFDAWYWSRGSIEAAMRAAGLGPVTWHALTQAEGTQPDVDPAFLRAFLARPHAVVTEAVRVAG